MKKLAVIVIAYLMFSTSLIAQDFDIIKKIDGNNIRVKIIPKTVNVYEAYRYNKLSCEVKIDGVPTRNINLKPAEESVWKASSNKKVAAAYEMLTRTGADTKPTSFKEMIDANKLLTYSHGFFMLLSSMDSEASKLSGLEFSIPLTSKKVSISLKNSLSDSTNTSWNFYPKDISYSENSPLIEGFNFEHAVKITWDHENYFKQVVAYIIQRKKKRGDFVDLDMPPKIYTTQEQDDPLIAYKMWHADSLEENYQDYTYRIIGLDAFGERMKPSNEVLLHGVDLTPPELPKNIKAKFENMQGEITWSAVNTEVDRILILRSDKGEKGPFEQLNKKYLTRKNQKYIDSDIDVEKTYYYLLLAADTAGNVAQSDLLYMDIPDHFPPNAPLDVKAQVDSSGNVMLYWHHSNNKDIRGYKVFRTDDLNQEYIQVSKGSIEENVFYDNLALNMHNSKAYYYVKALDKSYNNSVPSDTISVLRPDIISPSAPILRKAYTKEGQTFLAWIPSDSKDVSMYQVMEDTGSGWVLNSQVAANIITFQFQNPISSRIVDYKITAVDEAGNKSKNEASRKIVYVDTKSVSTDFTLTYYGYDASVRLLWQEDEYATLIYRAAADEEYSLLSRVSLGENKYKDEAVVSGKNYRYKIVKEAPNGIRTSLSIAQEISIK